LAPQVQVSKILVSSRNCLINSKVLVPPQLPCWEQWVSTARQRLPVCRAFWVVTFLVALLKLLLALAQPALLLRLALLLPVALLPCFPVPPRLQLL
jgi:hypothetical protein